jgi:hypothetical protein
MLKNMSWDTLPLVVIVLATEALALVAIALWILVAARWA